MNLLLKRRSGDENGGPYLDQNRTNYEKLRTDMYKEPYTNLYLGDNAPRGVEPAVFCPTCGEQGVAQGPGTYVCKNKNCKDKFNTEPNIIGPALVTRRELEDTGYPAYDSAVPTLKEPAGEPFAYFPVITNY